MGGGPGGFYTVEQFTGDRRRTPRLRFITVVPEIDVPGHTNAALASHPELNCDGVAPGPYTGIKVGFSALCPGKPETERFLNEVLTEVAALRTAGDYVHIGGDEVEKLSDAEYAQIVEQAAHAVTANRRKVVAWQEAGKTVLPPGSLVQYWQTNGGPEDVERAVAQGAKVVMSPASRVYLDMKYDDATQDRPDLGRHHRDRRRLRLGPGDPDRRDRRGQDRGRRDGPVDRDRRHDGRRRAPRLPRLPAIAEVAWTPQSERSFDAFAARLAPIATVWDRWGSTTTVRRASRGRDVMK